MKPTSEQLTKALNLLEERAKSAALQGSLQELPCKASLSTSDLQYRINEGISGSDWRRAFPEDKVLVIPRARTALEAPSGIPFRIPQGIRFDSWPGPKTSAFVWRPLFENESLERLQVENERRLEMEYVRDYLVSYMRKGYVIPHREDCRADIERACEQVADLFPEEDVRAIPVPSSSQYAIRLESPPGEVKVLFPPEVSQHKRRGVLSHVALNHHLALGHPLDQIEAVSLSYQFPVEGPPVRVEERFPALPTRLESNYRLFGTRKDAETLLAKCLEIYPDSAQMHTDNCGEAFVRIQYDTGSLSVYVSTTLEHGYFFVTSAWNSIERVTPQAMGVLREIGAEV